MNRWAQIHLPQIALFDDFLSLSLLALYFSQFHLSFIDMCTLYIYLLISIDFFLSPFSVSCFLRAFFIRRRQRVKKARAKKKNALSAVTEFRGEA